MAILSLLYLKFVQTYGDTYRNEKVTLLYTKLSASSPARYKVATILYKFYSVETFVLSIIIVTFENFRHIQTDIYIQNWWKCP